MNVNFGIRQISATLVQLRQISATWRQKAATKFVADICLIWIGCCSFFPSCCRYLPYLDRCCTFSPSRVDLCSMPGVYKPTDFCFFFSCSESTGLSTSTHTWVDIFRISLLDQCLPWGAFYYVKIQCPRFGVSTVPNLHIFLKLGNFYQIYI